MISIFFKPPLKFPCF